MEFKDKNSTQKHLKFLNGQKVKGKEIRVQLAGWKETKKPVGMWAFIKSTKCYQCLLHFQSRKQDDKMKLYYILQLVTNLGSCLDGSMVASRGSKAEVLRSSF